MRLMPRFLSLCVVLAASPALAADVPPSFADLVSKLTPAVVNVSTTQKMKGAAPGFQMFDMPEGGEVPEQFRDFFEQFGHKGKKGKGTGKEMGKEVEREVYSLGSGFIIDENGYIATNNHVIADAEEITVTLSDDTQLKAKIVGRDPKTDLALLKVDAHKKLPFVPLGDSDVSRVGDWVIAIGNPYGLGGTVTAGIISARARNINAGPFDDFIQTDAAINRGNSGGPMFNMKGEVIGINTAIFSPSGGSIGIGFAVPMAMAKPVLEQLKATGHINRGWLGVKIQHVSDEIADSLGLPKAEGALVMEVSKGGPGALAGIQSGDVVLKFDGRDVKEMRNLPRIVADTPIGKTVEVELWRKSSTMVIHVRVGELKEQAEASAPKGDGDDEPDAAPAPKAKELLGLSLAPLTPELREKYAAGADVKGVVILHVAEDSEAMKRGFQQGDIITQAGETPVAGIKDLTDTIAKAKAAGHKYILLRVLHGSDAVFETLPLEEKK